MMQEVLYKWFDISSSRSNKGFVRLHDIRLLLLYGDTIVSAVPVLVRDGRSPGITPYCAHVWRITSQSRMNKLVHGRLTEEERSHAIEVPLVFKSRIGEQVLFDDLANALKEETKDLPVKPFMQPMWCRWSKSYKDLYPRDNAETRFELGVRKGGDVTKADLKKAFDEVAGTPFIIGFANEGQLYDFYTIRSGGVVVVPSRKAVSENGSERWVFPEITGKCSYNDFRIIQKDWGVKLL